ncbi:hypothetical protein [Pararhizobium haloflavum]|uniref:hypothetical protein n=1 Tax=Pararhizobium haloflavum TaxID=2037914 RepID=UPI000C193991|nr:hypothetical protein [Pararhizobium haloflavum]
MVKLHSFGVTLDTSEQATIKAALIHWRNLDRRPEELTYLAGNCGEVALLEADELDQLIEKVSTPI